MIELNGNHEHFTWQNSDVSQSQRGKLEGWWLRKAGRCRCRIIHSNYAQCSLPRGAVRSRSSHQQAPLAWRPASQWAPTVTGPPPGTGLAPSGEAARRLCSYNEHRELALASDGHGSAQPHHSQGRPG